MSVLTYFLSNLSADEADANNRKHGGNMFQFLGLCDRRARAPRFSRGGALLATVSLLAAVLVVVGAAAPSADAQVDLGDTCVVAGGNDRGTGISQLATPRGLSVDDAGNIYIADEDIDRVVVWTPGATQGIIVAGGNGGGSGATQLDLPRQIFVDDGGGVYVAEWGNDRVTLWKQGTSQGLVVAGGNGIGSAPEQLSGPSAVFVDDGNVYVVDQSNHRVMLWKEGASEGLVVAGGNGRGNGLDQFDLPQGITLSDSGDLYIADQHNHRVMKWEQGASEGEVVAGGNGVGDDLDQLHFPTGVFLDPDDNLIVTDRFNHRVMLWKQNVDQGVILAGGIGKGSGLERLSFPWDTVRHESGDLYITDGENHRVIAIGSVCDRPPCTGGGFSDVAPGEFFADAVVWAFCRGITAGTTATTFSPFAPVSRGQLATFLWRLESEPIGFSHSFGDVPPGIFYEEAVAWMAEEGITTGTSDDTFSPNQTVNRAQLATFLWRYHGEPAGFTHPFTDVPADSFYEDAVAWMATEGITTGTSDTTFSPLAPLTRGQAVTFLARYDAFFPR